MSPRRRWRGLSPRWRGRVEWVVAVGGALAVALVLRATVIGVFSIPTGSMEPTLAIDDRIVVNLLSDDPDGLARGDIVVFDRPPVLRSGPAHLVKRILAFGGEEVEGRDGRVWVDGEPLDEPWLPEGVVTADFAPVTVAAGHLWVMGDNRPYSQDSRYFGPIDGSSLVGEVVWRFWPPDRIGSP